MSEVFSLHSRGMDFAQQSKGVFEFKVRQTNFVFRIRLNPSCISAENEKIMQCPPAPCEAGDEMRRFSQAVGSPRQPQLSRWGRDLSAAASVIILHCFTVGITSLNVFFVAPERRSFGSVRIVAHAGLLRVPRAQVRAGAWCLGRAGWEVLRFAGCHLQLPAGCHESRKHKGSFFPRPACCPVICTCARPLLS